MICEKCNKEIDQPAKFCPECGAAIASPTKESVNDRTAGNGPGYQDYLAGKAAMDAEDYHAALQLLSKAVTAGLASSEDVIDALLMGYFASNFSIGIGDAEHLVFFSSRLYELSQLLDEPIRSERMAHSLKEMGIGLYYRHRGDDLRKALEHEQQAISLYEQIYATDPSFDTGDLLPCLKVSIDICRAMISSKACDTKFGIEYSLWCAQRVLSITPDDHSIYFFMSKVMFAAEDYQGALDYTEKAEALGYHDPELTPEVISKLRNLAARQ